MKELKTIYNKISKQTQNRLQEIFDSINFDFNDLYNIANTKTKQRINSKIEEWKDKELLTGDFGTLANNIYRRTRVKNSEILELLIYGAYIEEQAKLKEPELEIMKQDVDYYYRQGQEEVNKVIPSNKRKAVSFIPDTVFLMILGMMNAQGYIWDQYIDMMIKYNADQIYRQMAINMQQGKENNIYDDVFQNIIKKQQNTKLNINGDKISGSIDNQLIGMNNRAKVEGMLKIDSDAKVRFIAVEDKVTTPMCHSLDGQIFSVNNENVFNRYYGETNQELRIERITCKGLIIGLNLPPISHHYHYCRSSITYQVPVEKQDKKEYNTVRFERKIFQKKYKEYTPEQIVKMAKEMDKVAEKYTDNKSKWSRKVVIDEFNINEKEWNCDIRAGKKTSPQILLHEHLHAHSISYYGKEAYQLYKMIEEATVELYNKEICKKENIIYDGSGYDMQVKALENINKELGIYEDNFDYAKYLFNTPVNKRIEVLNDFIYNKELDLDKLQYLQTQIEILGG